MKNTFVMAFLIISFVFGLFGNSRSQKLPDNFKEMVGKTCCHAPFGYEDGILRLDFDATITFLRTLSTDMNFYLEQMPPEQRTRFDQFLRNEVLMKFAIEFISMAHACNLPMAMKYSGEQGDSPRNITFVPGQPLQDCEMPTRCQLVADLVDAMEKPWPEAQSTVTFSWRPGGTIFVSRMAKANEALGDIKKQ